jgi:hypothetical protein
MTQILQTQDIGVTMPIKKLRTLNPLRSPCWLLELKRSRDANEYHQRTQILFLRRPKMKAQTRFYTIVLITISLFLAAATPGSAQSKMWMTPAEIMAALKPGQWVKMEGSVQKDLSVQCKELKILTGDFLDDEWSISMIVKNIDPEKQQVEIMRMPVKIKPDAEYQAGLKGFSDLKVGMYLDVDGTYLKDGTFLAKQVEDESIKLVEKPETANEVDIKGKVEKIDAANNTFTIMGITVRITDKTKSRSVIK